MHTVLIVDDYDTTRQLLHAVLEIEPYHVVSVASADQALAAIAVNRPSLILLDVRLHGRLDGLDLCRALKADEQTRHIPVIMLSGLGESWEKEAGYKAGADDYIVKPFYPDELIARIEAILANTSSGEALP